MMQTEQTDRIVDYLKTNLEPVFIYLIENRPDLQTEEVFLEIPYFAGTSTDEYHVCEIEDGLSTLTGCKVELIELSECDPVLAGELLAEGRLIYCQNPPAHIKYLHMLAGEFESIQLQRRILLERIKDCGTIFVQ